MRSLVQSSWSPVLVPHCCAGRIMPMDRFMRHLNVRGRWPEREIETYKEITLSSYSTGKAGFEQILNSYVLAPTEGRESFFLSSGSSKR